MPVVTLPPPPGRVLPGVSGCAREQPCDEHWAEVCEDGGESQAAARGVPRPGLTHAPAWPWRRPTAAQDEPPSEPQDPVDDEVAKALAAYKRPVSAEDILSKPIKLPPPPRLFRKRRHKLRMPRKRNVTDAWWLLHHAKRTRQNVTAPIPRFNLPARTREARGDEAWANRTQRAKEREIEEHRKDKERLRRELEEERKRSRRNDAQAIDNGAKVAATRPSLPSRSCPPRRARLPQRSCGSG